MGFVRGLSKLRAMHARTRKRVSPPGSQQSFGFDQLVMEEVASFVQVIGGHKLDPTL
jgi:hypothetical protein